MITNQDPKHQPSKDEISAALTKAKNFEEFLHTFYLLKNNFNQAVGQVSAIKNEGIRNEIVPQVIAKHVSQIEAFHAQVVDSNRHTATIHEVSKQLHALSITMNEEIKQAA